MRIRCSHCGAEVEVPQPAGAVCPKCNTALAGSGQEASAGGSSGGKQPSETCLPKRPYLFAGVVLGGLLHMTLGFLWGMCLGEERLEWVLYSFLIGGAAGFWGAYLPYRLARIRGKLWDWQVIAVSVFGFFFMFGLLYLIIPGYLWVTKDFRGEPFRKTLGDFVMEDSPSLITVCLVGLYFGSVIGYFARLSQGVRQSGSEKAPGSHLPKRKGIFSAVALSGFFHLALGIVVGICLGGERFDEDLLQLYLLIGAVCGLWGVYLPYRLARSTGKVFDFGVIFSSLVGSAWTLVLFYIIFPGYLCLLNLKVLEGFRWRFFDFFMDFHVFFVVMAAGMYFGSVIGYFARLAERTAASPMENPPASEAVRPG